MYKFVEPANIKIFDAKLKFRTTQGKAVIYGFSDKALKVNAKTKKIGFTSLRKRSQGEPFDTLSIKTDKGFAQFPVYRTHEREVAFWVPVGNNSYIGFEKFKLKDLFKTFRKALTQMG